MLIRGAQCGVARKLKLYILSCIFNDDILSLVFFSPQLISFLKTWHKRIGDKKICTSNFNWHYIVEFVTHHIQLFRFSVGVPIHSPTKNSLPYLSHQIINHGPSTLPNFGPRGSSLVPENQTLTRGISR